MKIELRGKTYHSVIIALNGKTFYTPRRGESKIIELTEIPKDLLQLEELGIIRINNLSKEK